jgi:dTDP-4-amino-4,6-dideoxygalactose transaminase
MIPFNKPYLTGRETEYISQAVASGKISGDGIFTKKVHTFFEGKYGFRKVLLTTSCTDALEMAAILINIQLGDEVIMPSYTFVSTANAFVLRGAKIVFADSSEEHPNIDVTQIEKLITPRTRAIVPVHYAGVACDMDVIMELATKYQLFVIEDAAQAIDSFYTGKDGLKKPLGSIGHLAAFSFHETKNIISGEGGMLVINDERFIKRAEIIREKGTNRSAFFRGEIDKYGWVDIGSSFLPSDIIAAFLWAQLENLGEIQAKRKQIWERYQQKLANGSTQYKLPFIFKGATNNAHMFYLLTENQNERDELIHFLRGNNIHPVFHYISLHGSTYFNETNNANISDLKNSDKYSGLLVRLPMYFELGLEQVDFICSKILEFYNEK